MKNLLNVVKFAAKDLLDSKATQDIQAYCANLAQKAYYLEKDLKNNPTIAKLNSKFRSTGFSQFALHVDGIYYVPQLWKEAAKKQVEIVTLDMLTKVNQPITPDAAIDRTNVPNVDTSYPIIVDENYRILDGRHRWQNSVANNLIDIKIIKLDTCKLESCGRMTMFGPLWDDKVVLKVLKAHFTK